MSAVGEEEATTLVGVAVRDLAVASLFMGDADLSGDDDLSPLSSLSCSLSSSLKWLNVRMRRSL
eukprot:CAMPEP_0113905896 /NCGR_PEP_ID=MMETSP0780_2-20120614/24358_1 /TAXON_ID=652834 /ORGANISM="Palpitomonas bilix" /LENGTH=63 /DNA_ID=CAMNT_0000900259 /DNA_START=334 /DNA_END=525 /DNA_ORIENTATION=+ /assembly_acc=CAM_ASM_000599